MNNHSLKKARKRLRETQREVAREAIARRIMPLWRRVVGLVAPSVRANWIMTWDKRHAAALKAAMKKASHALAKGRA